MDDKACRLEILRELKKTYDEERGGACYIMEADDEREKISLSQRALRKK